MSHVFCQLTGNVGKLFFHQARNHEQSSQHPEVQGVQTLEVRVDIAENGFPFVVSWLTVTGVFGHESRHAPAVRMVGLV